MYFLRRVASTLQCSAFLDYCNVFFLESSILVTMYQWRVFSGALSNISERKGIIKAPE